MADVNRGARPLSPHLSVYKMQITMLVSILTRITGAGLILAFPLTIWWALAAATGTAYFDTVNWIVSSWIGAIIYIGSLWALWFHTLSGIRHLIMDFGIGYDLDHVTKSAWATLIGSVVLTAITLLIIL